MRTTLRLLAIALGASVVSYAAGNAIVGSDIPFVVHLSVMLVIACTHRIVLGVRPPKRTDPMIREDSDAPDMRLPDRPFAQMRVWEERLELVRGDADYFRANVLPALGELVDERLRLSHGFTRAEEPDRARAVIGERLWAFLDATSSPPRAPTPTELREVVRQMEELWASRR
ncbi:MAG TPA: hypothetical protein VI076_14505 [Actinopolymorphaceae bacterium]